MRILHITDTHVGWEPDREEEEKAWERLYRETAAAVSGSHCEKADIIAVTGDLVMHGTEEEYRRAEGYLHGLGNILGIEEEQIFFCCGNHDSDTPDAGSTFHEYQAFAERFYGGKVPSCQVPVFSINSCKRTSLKDFNDCWLDPHDVDEILEKAVPGQKGILLMHHQPEIFDDQSQMTRLSDAVGLILGGHLHSGYARQIAWKGMTAVNGMAVTPHFPFVPKGFQIVDLSGDGTVETTMYAYREGQGVWEQKA